MSDGIDSDIFGENPLGESRLGQGRDVLRLVIRRAIHSRTHRVGNHLVDRVGRQEGLDGFHNVRGGIEPLALGAWWQDEGHPVVNGLEHGIRRGRQGGARFQGSPSAGAQ